MEAKIKKISELSKLSSVKTRMTNDLFLLFGKFCIGHLLSRLSLVKHDGVSSSELILSLCLFRIVGKSIHSICKHKIYELSNHGKNCFYRMMIRPQMDWRRLMNHFALCYMYLLRKYSEAPQSNTTTCFIIDDTVLEKSGVRMEGISRVYDHVKGRFILGYKLLLCAFFDSKTTIHCDFSLHQEKGNKETKLYIRLGSYQSCDLNDQIVDITLLYLTYTVMALEKRCTKHQTMGEFFSDMENDLMALTLWKRILTCIERILRVLGEVLGLMPQHLMATISGNDKELSKILVMAEALEKWDEVYGQTT